MTDTEPRTAPTTEMLVEIASLCEPQSWDQDPLVELYQVAVRIGRSGHACTSLSRLDPRTRQLTIEELGCYHVVATTRRTALQCLRYAIETAIGELSQE